MEKEIVRTKKFGPAEKMFSGWNDTLIFSCLQDVMGAIYYDDDENPKSALAKIGDFAFYEGEPDERLLRFKPVPESGFVIMAARNPEWFTLVEKVYGGRCEEKIRYATKKDTTFNYEILKSMVSKIPEGYSVEDLYSRDDFDFCRESPVFRDFISLFRNHDDYCRRGQGIIIKKDGQIVAGASSYSVYNGGIEIEIQTLEEHRRKGLASVSASSLILKCLEKNLYPSWDAANTMSLELSKKLGYEFDHEYKVFFVYW